MKCFGIALACLVFSVSAFAQTADTDPATRDDVILYLQTMHSHDMMRKLIDAMVKSMGQMSDDAAGKGNITSGQEAQKTKREKMLGDMMKAMPMDEMMQAMIPAYQKHFTRGDIAAMNAFYASPVGQKVLEELPAVTQEGMLAAMPIMKKYVSEWQNRMQHELDVPQKGTSKDAGQGDPSAQN